MKYKRFWREGPGEMPPIDFATKPEELRVLTDEETADIVYAKNAAIETQDALLIARQTAAENEGQLNAMLESEKDIAARLSPEALAKGYKEKVTAALNRIIHNPDALPAEKEWVAKIHSKTALDTGDLRTLDELEMLQAARNAADSEAAGVAVLEENVINRAGDLKLMRDDEVAYSIENERRMSGELIPDEVIEVETPIWLKGDPEFATKEDPNALRLVDTEEELDKSYISQRKVEAQRDGAVELIEVSAPNDEDFAEIIDESKDTVPLAPKNKPSLQLSSEEKDEIARKLGPSAAPRHTPQAKAPPQGLVSRIKGWFGR